MRGGRETVDEAQDDLRAFGAPEEVIEEVQPGEVVFEIEPENWDVVVLWSRVQTQWRDSGFGRSGLDYVAVDVVMRRTGMSDEHGETFAGLQVMEMAALQAMTATRK